MPTGITLNKISELKRSSLNCNVFSVYDYDCLSMQELLCTFFEKINQCVDVTNKTVVLVEWLVSQGLKEEVAKKLESWLIDGTLANIINETVFKELNNKVKVNTQNIESLNGKLNEYMESTNTKLNNINHKLDSVFVFSDTYPSLQEAHDAVVAMGGGILSINKDYELTEQFRWDVRKVIIDGNGHSLTFNMPVKSTFGIRTISSETWTHPFHQATNNIKELKMYFNKGNGLLLEGESSAKACSHVTFDKCTISDVGNAIRIGNNAYLVKFVDCDIFDSTNVMSVPDTVTNSGENIQFRGCTIYNNTGGFDINNGTCDVFFSNCSFDYFERGSIFDINNGKVYLSECHIEFDTSKSSSIPFSVRGDSGFINIDNSQILLTNSGVNRMQYLFNTVGGQARINLTKSFLYGIKSASGWMCGGSGRLYTRDNILNVVPECDLKINPGTTQSVSGSMVTDTIVDAILTEDSGDKSSLTGNNIQVSMVKDGNSYKYGRSIKINKSAGAGQVGAVRFFAPIHQGSTNNLDIVIKRISGSGAINLTYGYCSYNGKDIAEDQKGWEAIDPQGEWMRKGYFMTNAPMWATHMYINIATSQATPSDIRIGEISANSF